MRGDERTSPGHAEGRPEGKVLSSHRTHAIAANHRCRNMDKPTAYTIVNAARALIKGVNENASESTVAQYKAAYTRMEREGLTPEKMAGTARSYYFYRAALVHHVATEIRQTLTHTDRAAKQGLSEAWEQGVKRLEQLVHTLDHYRPDPDGKHLDQRIISRWAVEAEKRQRLGERIHSHSKRSRLRGLPMDWRDQMFEGAKNSKYQNAIAVLAATGARPAEFEKGILIGIANADTLRFTIAGVKLHNGKYGQETRTLEISANTLATKHLLNLAQAQGQLRIEAKAGSLSDFVRHLGQRTFPQLRKATSAYVFRHQFAADLKGDGLDGVDVAIALGHCVNETQGFYGTARNARSSGGLQKVTGTRAVREKTAEKMHQLSLNRSYEKSLSG